MIDRTKNIIISSIFKTIPHSTNIEMDGFGKIHIYVGSVHAIYSPCKNTYKIATNKREEFKQSEFCEYLDNIVNDIVAYKNYAYRM